MDFSLENLKQYCYENERTIVLNRNNFNKFIKNVAIANPGYTTIASKILLSDDIIFNIAFSNPEINEVSLYFEDDGLAFRKGSFNPYFQIDYYDDLSK